MSAPEIRALRGPAHSAVLLALIGFALTPDAGRGAAPSPQARVAALLARLHRRLRKDAAAFARLSDDERHRLRKRLKRLRYGIELSGALFPRRKVEAYLATLRPAHEALGRLNDLVVAEALFRGQTAQDGRAWFAVGWLAARRPAQAEAALRALARAFARKRPTVR